MNLLYAGKPNLIISTDIGGDPDDQQSLVRFLVFSNEFNVKGIIPMAFNTYSISSSAQMNLVETYINAYGQVVGKLSQNSSGYPSKSQLSSILKRGATGIPVGSGSGSNVENNLIGSGKDSEGSDWIIYVVDNNSSVYISIWGGAVDVAQALWKVKNTRSSSELNQFVSKIRIYAINDQDDSGFWIRANFPNLFYILGKSRDSNRLNAVWRGMYLGGNEDLTSKSWVTSHVTSHGPLGALYPTSTYTQSNPHGCLKEGDTPSWFYFLENGLNKSSSPQYGGWGGRFTNNSTYYQDAKDHVDNVTNARATVWRWREDFQNEFQARMDWCINSYGNANHKPNAIISGDLSRTVKSGDYVTLDASACSDPDGNSLSYYWFHYPEPGSYSGNFTVPNNSASIAQFTAPYVSSTKTMHIILKVKDNGNPNLTSYQRVVLTINPGGSSSSETVSAPNRPDGPTTGSASQSLSYNIGGSSSNLGHTIEYQFYWGDGNYSGWGSSSQSHSYANSGTYSIRAQARCKSHTNYVSNWSTSKSITITAKTYSISISIIPSGKGTVTKNPTKNSYNYYETVWLMADPSSDYFFDKWGSDLSGSTNPKKITMNYNKSVTAYFKQIPETVSTPNQPSGPSSGTVDEYLTYSTWGSASSHGHSVHYQFYWGDGNQSEWSSNTQNHLYSNPGTYSIQVRARCKTQTNILSDWSAGKNISISGYELNISISPSATGTVALNPEKYQFNSGEVVQLKANPASEYLFDKWGGFLSGSSNPRTITMNDNLNITAYFKQIPEEISTPNKLTGNSNGKVDQNLTFITGGSSSNLDHSVEYHFNWGDGTLSSWDGITRSHVYTNPGTYQIQTQARCRDHPNIVSGFSESWFITITPNIYSISGKVSYYSGEQPVSNVTVAVSGDSDLTRQTDTNGDYSINLECDKNFKLMPLKAKGTDIRYSDITMYDAVLTARHSMDLEQLDNFQRIAADVDRDGNVSLYDAVQIARYTIELPSPDDSSCVGEWTFSPSEYFYQNLNSNFSEQNFFGIILGNVHGQWLPPGNLRKKEPKTLSYQYLDKIQIENEQVILPIIIDQGQNIRFADIELMYDSNALSFKEIIKTKLSKKFNSFYNNRNDQLRVGMFSVTSSNEGGVLLKLIFTTNPSFNNRVYFHLKRFKINNEINMQSKTDITFKEENSSINKFNLSQSYPNPFNSSTQFNLDLLETGYAYAVIYNIKGQEIIKLIENNFPAGQHILKWSGTNEAGAPVNSGIYLLKLIFNGRSGNKESSTRRIILMK